MSVLDWRDRQTPSGPPNVGPLKRGKLTLRDPAKVTGVTLHQTACWYLVVDYQLKAARGDEKLARHARAMNVHAHLTAMRHGDVVVAHDPLTYLWHGDLWNPTDIGLEHEGEYDEAGNPIDMPPGVDVGNIIDAGRQGLTWLVDRYPNLRYLHAHRQARTPPKAAKTADPGRRIFREVGIEHGVKKLGLRIEPLRALGNGHPLPESWFA